MANGSNSEAALRNFVERIENLEEQKKAIAEDIKLVFSEAKVEGFDTKVMRRVISLRKMDPAARQELLSLTDVYLRALGEAAGDEGELV